MKILLTWQIKSTICWLACFEHVMSDWHVRKIKTSCLLTCSTRNDCWYDRMSRARYLLICSNDKNIICSNWRTRWAKSRSRVRHARSYIWIKYIKMMRLQCKQCIKTNFTKIKSISSVLKCNQINYTMIAIKLSRNLNQCKTFKIQINKIYQAVRSSKYDKSRKRSVWSRQYQIFDWNQQIHTFE